MQQIPDCLLVLGAVAGTDSQEIAHKRATLRQPRRSRTLAHALSTGKKCPGMAMLRVSEGSYSALDCDGENLTVASERLERFAQL